MFSSPYGECSVPERIEGRVHQPNHLRGFLFSGSWVWDGRDKPFILRKTSPINWSAVVQVIEGGLDHHDSTVSSLCQDVTVELFSRDELQFRNLY